ncbi:HTTM domain-containing protein [Tropicibacter naphthalenivorans]|uniref:HTTM-like domain-containing protein n=1 Tax=Tropicibacter naphthalenivorans TaxID=441103 RepID=A0A0P1GWI5_9RHOB|nr:HTTM domain-containing protein [Tropicibacter naphthalenivorans]CUH79389.1 hypothetical protein TRN7648_02446 [Tropicibacter naphthalenivorans]SMC71855.1 Vitamin K-dependent gamma-carboxylase [Tropicibacter naphthalenivorans]
MSFDLALRATEVLLALAILQHSAEHLVAPMAERRLFIPRMALAVLVLAGVGAWAVWALWLWGLVILRRFDGPYNGGSDKMTLLVLTCVALVYLAPTPRWQEMALAYLAVQLTLSYFVSGWIKVINPTWRSGEALCDVFRYSAYPVSRNLRGFANWPGLLFVASWAVMGLELVFPLTLLHPNALIVGLALCALFHISNACFFGLNRFVWAWISAFPSLIWFQDRIL